MANNIFTGQKTVSNSGTPVQLPAQSIDPDQAVLVKAKVSNTGIITLGYDSLSALNSDTKHFKLAAGESVEIPAKDVSKIWIDATVSGEGVEILIA